MRTRVKKKALTNVMIFFNSLGLVFTLEFVCEPWQMQEQVNFRLPYTETALQHITSCFAEAAELFGLEVSLQKTEVLHQPAPQEVYQS